MKNQEIKLGDKVKDKITGYEGIAVARCEFINGCVQYVVAKQRKSNEEMPEKGEPSIDAYSLLVIKKRVIDSKEYEKEDTEKPIESRKTGGPTRFVKRSNY